MATSQQERLVAQSLVLSIWMDKLKYEDAERKYQEIIADKHSGLKIQGKGITPMKSDISSFIVEAKSKIQESLRAVPSKPTSTQVELENRVTKLEIANAALTKRVEYLEQQLKNVLLPHETKQRTTNEVKKDEEEDDFDLFGSDEDEDLAEKVKQERVAAYKTKKSNKPAIVAKSSIILEVKPWDDETDMNELEKCVRSIETDGLTWKASKLVPVAYGIQKLQINCIVEDDKIGTDFLEEEITKFEDYVQSVDIAAFNKL